MFESAISHVTAFFSNVARAVRDALGPALWLVPIAMLALLLVP